MDFPRLFSVYVHYEKDGPVDDAMIHGDRFDAFYRINASIPTKEI